MLDTPLVEGLATKKMQLINPEKGWYINADVTCVYRSAFYRGTITGLCGKGLKISSKFL